MAIHFSRCCVVYFTPDYLSIIHKRKTCVFAFKIFFTRDFSVPRYLNIQMCKYKRLKHMFQNSNVHESKKIQLRHVLSNLKRQPLGIFFHFAEFWFSCGRISSSPVWPPILQKHNTSPLLNIAVIIFVENWHIGRGKRDE